MGMVLDSVALSLGGYVTGPGGDMSWLTPHLGPNPEMEDLRRDIGATTGVAWSRMGESVAMR